MKYPYPSIATIISGIVIIILGALIMSFGWNLHTSLKQSYNCIPCYSSAFDEECDPGFDTEENHQCWDNLEWPYKFSFGVTCLGFATMLSPFVGVFTLYYNYFKEKKKNEKRRKK